MLIDANQAYRIWAPTYDAEPNPLVALETRIVSGLLRQLTFQSVVDVGCGTGRSLLLTNELCELAVGIDTSQAMLQQARARVKQSTLLVQGHSQSLPIRESTADLLVCSLSLGYMRDLDRVFREFTRVTRVGGKVLVSDLHPAAIESGWTRSFKADGVRYEIENWPHSLEQIKSAACKAGLRECSAQAASFGDAEQKSFRAAGKTHLFSEAQRIPALYALLWEKPC